MKPLGFDTETYLISDREKAPKPVCCTWFDGVSKSISRPDDAVTYNRIADPESIFIGHNIPYDILVMMRWHPWCIPFFIRALDEGRVFDTQTRYSLIHLGTEGIFGYDPQVSLKKLVLQHFQVDLSESKQGDDIWRMKYGTLDGVPFSEWPTEALSYAMDDAEWTWRVFFSQGGFDNAQPTENVQVQSAVVLAAVGVWGFGLDRSVSQRLYKRQVETIRSLKEDLDKYGWQGKGSEKRLGDAVTGIFSLHQFNITGQHAQMRGIVLDTEAWKRDYYGKDLAGLFRMALASGQFPSLITEWPEGTNPWDFVIAMIDQLPLLPRTLKKKKPITSEDVLKHLYYLFPDFEKFIQLKHEEKMLSTYVEPYYGKDVSNARYIPIHSTGRTGCRSPNHQNIPERGGEGYRTQFCARPGYLLGTVDYSGLELCTLAATIRTMFPNVRCVLGDLIDQGTDCHSYLASIITNKPYEEFVKNKGSQPWKDERQGAKAGSFGYPGGLSAGMFVAYAESNYGVVLTVEESQKIKDAWSKAFPEISDFYLKEAKTTVPFKKRGTAKTITGREKANCTYTEYANFRFQGLAADGAKVAMYFQWREMVLGYYYSQSPHLHGYGSEYRDSPLRMSRMAAFVHDEIVDEHPEGPLGEEAFKRQKQLMVEAMEAACQGKITITVEGKLDARWDH